MQICRLLPHSVNLRLSLVKLRLGRFNLGHACIQALPGRLCLLLPTLKISHTLLIFLPLFGKQCLIVRYGLFCIQKFLFLLLQRLLSILQFLRCPGQFSLPVLKLSFPVCKVPFPVCQFLLPICKFLLCLQKLFSGIRKLLLRLRTFLIQFLLCISQFFLSFGQDGLEPALPLLFTVRLPEFLFLIHEAGIGIRIDLFIFVKFDIDLRICFHLEAFRQQIQESFHLPVSQGRIPSFELGVQG